MLTRHHLDRVLPAMRPGPADPPFTLSDSLRSALFDGDAKTYALLDGAKIPYLAERFEQDDIAALCLYNEDPMDPDVAQIGPWLAELERETELLTSLFCDDPDEKDPFVLWRLDAAVYLRASLSLEDLRSHLRRYTFLPDEGGARRFVRLQEPGYLDAMLVHSAAGPDFFEGISQLTYPMRTIEDDVREFWALTTTVAPSGRRVLPTIDANVRTAFKALRSEFLARDLAREVGGPMGDREHRRAICFRALQAGFDNPSTLRRTAHILMRTPDVEHQGFWQAAESGQYSLGHLNHLLAHRYDLRDLPE
jgi:hypothetical protein